MIKPLTLLLPLLSVALLTGCSSMKKAGDQTARAVNAINPWKKPAPIYPPQAPRELRAAWVATVANIDWPSKPGLSVAKQVEEMRAIIEKAAELNLNAIVLQV